MVMSCFRLLLRSSIAQQQACGYYWRRTRYALLLSAALAFKKKKLIPKTQKFKSNFYYAAFILFSFRYNKLLGPNSAPWERSKLLHRWPDAVVLIDQVGNRPPLFGKMVSKRLLVGCLRVSKST